MSSTVLRQTTPPVDGSRRAGRGTYFIQTWGCQMNEEDSDQIALHLARIGFSPASDWQDAQVILLNTCSVRKKPEDKAFSLLGHIEMLKDLRPEIVVGVCGCMAQLRSAEIHKRAPFVDFVVGTGQIAAIPGLVEEALQQRRFRTRLELPERKGAVVSDVPKRQLPSSPLEGEDLPAKREEVGGQRGPKAAMNRCTPKKLKAFVPIQYGCDKFCTFCIVPVTRGRERSRPTEDIVREVRALARLGTKEVTLLGQTVNSYGKNLAEGRVPFSNLLRLLSGIPGIERIRYTSPYPRDFKTDLIECIRDCPQVMEHVHLPLQSGDNEILKSMRRVYSVEEFLEIVRALRDAIPHVGLTTDVIVGFPGETEEQFERTVDVIEKVRFDGAFMFAYSPRPGTPASTMTQISAEIKRRRLSRLIDIQHRITIENNEKWIGREMEVLVEGPSPKDPRLLQGYSREYLMVHFSGAADFRGEIVNVKGTQAHRWGLSGKLV